MMMTDWARIATDVAVGSLSVRLSVCLVLYLMKEYHPLLDSSNMMMTDWARIATDVAVGSLYVSIYPSICPVHYDDRLG